MTLESSSFTVTGLPHVSVLFDLILPAALFKRVTLVSAITCCVSRLPRVSSKSSDEEKEIFLARVESLPVTSRSHVTDGQTTVRLV